MKNMFKVFGIIFMVMMIGFFAGCKDSNSDSATFPSKLRGTWWEENDGENFAIEVTKDDLTISGSSGYAQAARAQVEGYLDLGGEWFVEDNAVIGIELQGMDVLTWDYVINGDELTIDTGVLGMMVFIKQ